MKHIKVKIQEDALNEWRALRTVLLEVAREHPNGERESLVEIARRLVAAPTAKPGPTFPLGSWCIRASTPDAPGLDGEWLRPRVCRVVGLKQDFHGAHSYGLELFEDASGWNEPSVALRSAGTSYWHELRELIFITDMRVAARCAMTELHLESMKAHERAVALNARAQEMAKAIDDILRVGPIIEGAPDV